MATIEVKVPDIGDFKDVPVIELLVKPGDAIKVEQALITLESDKATMDVPSPLDGVVKEILVKPGDKVKAEDALISLESDKATMDVPSPTAGTVKDIALKIGDKVSEGTLILTLTTGVTAAAPAKPAPAPAAASAVAPAAGAYGGSADVECEMLVLGAGPGGYSAAFRSADLGMKTVLVERYATLGGVCLNVGCIPSKALLHVAAIADEAEALADHGLRFGKPEIDLTKLRGWKEKVVGKLTGGLAGMAKARKVEVVRGVGRFVDPHHLEVQMTSGSGQEPSGAKKVVRFEKAIIAAGSQAVKLTFIPDDPRVVDSTGALELAAIPKR